MKKTKLSIPKKMKNMTLDELLEEVSVTDDFENEVSALLEGWFAVMNTDGIIAYFGNEADAFRFRLDYINLILNS